MSKSAVEVLREARELVETPATWVKGMHSAYRNGEICFCVYGAVDTVRKQDGKVDILEWKALKRASGARTPIQLNDDPATTHADVIALFNRAIALAAEEP